MYVQRLALPVAALVLLLGLSVGAQAQESPLGKAVASLFADRQQVQHVAHAAWRTAKDDGPQAAMVKSLAHLQKATASAEIIPAQAAPDAFAAWWYNVAAQYWCEKAARHRGREGFAKAIEGITLARQDLERALGWDAKIADPAFREAYRLMQGFK